MDLQTIAGFSFSWGEPPHLLAAPWLAKWLGLFITAMSLFCLVKRESVQAAVADIKKSPGLQVLSGSFNVLMGSLIIALHPGLEADWSIFITLFGYITLFRGLIRLFLPHEEFKVLSNLDKSHIFHFIWSVLWLIVGLVLIWFGFFHRVV